MDVTAHPHDASLGGETEPLLRAAIAAPSLHNSQPWLFAVGNDEVRVYADPTRHLVHADPSGRAMLMSVGAALLNLRVAAEHLGRAPAVTLETDASARGSEPLLVATVALDRHAGEPGPLARLHDAVPTRRTNRRPFRDQPPPPAALAAMAAAARAEGAELTVYDDPADVAWTVGLLHEADLADRMDVAVPGERAAWIGGPGRDEGIPVGSLGPVPADVETPFRDLGAGVAAPREYAVFEQTPTVAVLATAADEPADWVRAGQALEHLLLEATTAGLAASFMNQPLEHPAFRARILAASPTAPFPQMLLRIGYGDPVPPTPRRDLAAVLLPPET
jgi:nitroreductase